MVKLAYESLKDGISCCFKMTLGLDVNFRIYKRVDLGFLISLSKQVSAILTILNRCQI